MSFLDTNYYFKRLILKIHFCILICKIFTCFYRIVTELSFVFFVITQLPNIEHHFFNIFLCKQLPQIKTLTFVGRNSICFYFMSGALPITLSAIVKMFYSQVSPLGLFLIFGLTLIGAYIASLVIVKYLPWMLDIRKLRK